MTNSALGTLALRHVAYRYPGHQQLALSGLNLSLRAGEKVALLGRNGSGKSTLMLHCNGILRPQQGELWLDGQPITYTRESLRRLRQRVGLVWQNPDDQLFSASVRQDISFGPLNLDLSEAVVRQRIAEVAELCALTALLDRPTHALSGGEKVRVALAGVLAMSPTFLIADELTSSLDPWMKQQVMEILDAFVARGGGVVLATHDWPLVRQWAERVVWLEAGQIGQDAPPAEILWPETGGYLS
jgi:cobalt/nickel transport system ATP-binding protein